MEMFIDSDKKFDVLIKSLKLNINMEQHNELVCQLYKHIEYTRRYSYKSGYDQGKFDERIESQNGLIKWTK